MRATTIIFSTLVCFVVGACSGVADDASAEALPVGQEASLELVWSDEFDYEGLPDSSRWSYNVGDACDLPIGCGWGNNELQYYTERRLENARVENGHLIIEAHREDYQGRDYTSARLLTLGKGDWRYGRMEARARLPQGKGVWAAIWMLPSAGEYGHGEYGHWPHSGEIDIMEHVGFLPDSVFGNTHTLAYNGMHNTDEPGSRFLPDAEDVFHTYAIDWQPDRIDFLVDGEKFHEYLRQDNYEVWPFDKPFYLVLNIAVGGNWGGRYGVDESVWPQRMVIDYVRVYQNKSLSDLKSD